MEKKKVCCSSLGMVLTAHFFPMHWQHAAAAACPVHAAAMRCPAPVLVLPTRAGLLHPEAVNSHFKAGSPPASLAHPP